MELFLSQINWDYIIATLIVFALFAGKIWLLPYLKLKGINQKYINMIEEALLLGNMMFRSEKILKILKIALGIVTTLEVLENIDSQEKHNDAVGELSQKLLYEMNVELDKPTLDRIVRIAVSLMGEI